MEEKRKRREAREAKKRAEELAALKAEIQLNFIDKGESVQDINVQEVLEMDGHDIKGNFVGALGGMLGQLILTLSILEKNFNRQLTSKSTKSKKSSKSGKSKKTADAKSQKDEEESKKKAEEEEAKSQKSKAGDKTDADGSTIQQEKEFDPYTEPTIKEKGWFTKQNIQNFIHTYIAEKLRTEKMQVLVGNSFEFFLANLEKPMALNTGMRLMKEPNYSKFRGLIRDPTKFGDRILARLYENCDKIGLSLNSF